VLGFSKTDLPLGLSCVAELLTRCVHGNERARPRESEDFPRPFWNRVEDGGVLRVAGKTGV